MIRDLRALTQPNRSLVIVAEEATALTVVTVFVFYF